MKYLFSIPLVLSSIILVTVAHPARHAVVARLNDNDHTKRDIKLRGSDGLSDT